MSGSWTAIAIVWSALALLALAAGCGQAEQPPGPTPTASRTSPAPSATSAGSATPMGRASPSPATSEPTLATLPRATVQAATAAVPSTPAPTPIDSAAPSPSGGVALQDRMVEAAKQDLSRRMSVPAGDITVVSISPQEWRDTSLGCPQPGGMYAQVITPGYRLVLETGGKQYEYHTDSSSRAILCQVP